MPVEVFLDCVAAGSRRSLPFERRPSLNGVPSGVIISPCGWGDCEVRNVAYGRVDE
jgi:hypothetical protein